MPPQIKITPHANPSKDTSNGEASFTIDITMDGVGTGDYGWIIQKVTRKFRVYECQGCNCAKAKAAHFENVNCEPHVENGIKWVFDQTYIEAWQLYNGEVYQGSAKYKDKSGKEQFRKPGAQDTFSNGDWKGRVCGFFSSEGVLKFFTNEELRQHPLINPPVWGQLEKVVASRQLPSSDDTDRIKEFDATGTAITQRHSFEVTFDNCAGNGKTFTIVVDYAPQVAAGGGGGGNGGGGKKKKVGKKRSAGTRR